jgi:hypothetical protein
MRLQSETARVGWGLIPVRVTLEGRELEAEVSRASAERDYEWLRQAIRLAQGDRTTDEHVHEIVLTELLHCLLAGGGAEDAERAAERIGYLLWLALDEGSWAEATEISLAIGHPSEGGADLEIALSVS